MKIIISLSGVIFIVSATTHAVQEPNVDANESRISASPNSLTDQSQSKSIVLSKVAERKEVWISSRTDGIAGNGTATDPYDGSTQPKFDALMRSIPSPAHIHLDAGNFYTKKITPKENWIIEGAGKYLTIISLSNGRATTGGREGRPTSYKVIGNEASVSHGHPSGFVNYFSVRNLTVDCNRDNQPVYTKALPFVKLYAIRAGAKNAEIINVCARGIWINAGKPGKAALSEGFPVNVEHDGTANGTDRIVFEGCDVIDPLGYLTAISAWDQYGGSVAGAIKNSYVENHKGGSCFGGGSNWEISGNHAYNCYTGTTIDTGNFTNLRIFNNRFVGMLNKGVNMLNGSGTYTNIVIHDNYFDLGPEAIPAIGHSGRGQVKDIQIYHNTIIQRSRTHPAISFKPGTTGSVRDNIISEVIPTNLSATDLAVSGNVTPDNVPLSLGRTKETK